MFKLNADSAETDLFWGNPFIRGSPLCVGILCVVTMGFHSIGDPTPAYFNEKGYLHFFVEVRWVTMVKKVKDVEVSWVRFFFTMVTLPTSR